MAMAMQRRNNVSAKGIKRPATAVYSENGIIVPHVPEDKFYLLNSSNRPSLAGASSPRGQPSAVHP